MKIENKVFLGGTAVETIWREELIPNLEIDFFNPIVKDWNAASQILEEKEKSDRCNIHLYVIMSSMTGVFSVAEAIESSMTEGKICIFHVIPTGFGFSQIKSLDATCEMVRKHGGISFIDTDLQRSARIINNSFK